MTANYKGGVLFKEQLKRFWLISALLFITLLFIVILPIYYIQKQIIDSRDYLRGEYIKMREGGVPYEFYVNDPTFPYKYFVYRLKNGRTIAREYFLPPEFIKASGLREFMNREDIILSAYPSLKTPDKINQLGPYE